MDTGRWGERELTEPLRQAVAQVRRAPDPAALARALDRARHARRPGHLWLHWLLRGAAARN